MPKRKLVDSEDPQMKCSNSSCGFVFSKPLKVLNLRSENREVYDACPRCFTELSVERVPPIVFKEKSEGEEVMVEVAALPDEKVEPSVPVTTPVSCAFHLGYLSERSKNEKIPDDCVVCEKILACMLKKIDE